MDILVIYYDWNLLLQRAQQISRQLSRGHRVVYWHNRSFWGRLLVDAVKRSPRDRRPADPAPICGLSDPVVVGIPQMLPYRLQVRRPDLNFRLIRTLSRDARNALRSKEFDAAILCTYETADVDFWTQVPARIKVFDCADDAVHFFAPGSAGARNVLRTEARILGHADLVFASAPKLLERLSTAHRRVVLVPNGADVAHFAFDPSRPVPAELESVRGPVLGYVGAIESWIDVELIARTADILTEYTVVLVGPAGCDVSALAARKNILLAGRKPYAELPGWLQRFDVCMLPFSVNELTRSVDPIKFYEYCAAGKPSVSTRLPTMVARGDMVYLAGGPEEFASQVRRAQSEDSPALRERRVTLARENSWAARAEVIVRAIPNMAKAGESSADGRQPSAVRR